MRNSWWIGALALATVACAATDNNVKSSGGTGGTSGAAGSGGSGATGGSAGAGGSAGSAGSAGADGGGAAGSSGSGGTSGSGGSSGSAGSGGSTGDASASKLLISEIFVDRNLAGDAHEWIEISGPPGTPIGDLSLRHYRWESASNPTVLVFDLAVAPTGTQMPSNGFWTVGGYQSPALQSYTIASPDNFGLDGSAGSLQLYRPSNGQLLDAVGYGGAQPANAPSAPTTTMYGSAAPLAQSGTDTMSTARRPGSAAQDNSVDFCVQDVTPNGANGSTCK